MRATVTATAALRLRMASRGHGNEMQRAVELRGACAPGNSTRFPFILETARRECTQRTDFHRDYSDIC